MKYLKLLVIVFLTATNSFAQDTTWVQTFTFDSIVTRRANFEFPAELNNKRFEKVLMYYKLKCSPLTTWDQYDCGEWDYLTYTRVFDHTGEYDSVQVDGNRFISNLSSPAQINFTPYPYSYVDSYPREERNRSGASLTINDINSNSTTTQYPFHTNNRGGKFQMLVTAAELTNAGITAGNIESLSLYLTSIGIDGELKFPTISVKGTTDAVLTTFHSTGFVTSV
jgi:hypothetical protein